MSPTRFSDGIEVIEDRLYWLTDSGEHSLRDTPDTHYFSIDDVLVYEPYVYDFGPVDLGMTHRYITLLQSKMADAGLASKAIVHYCRDDDEKRANAAYLISAYMVVVHHLSPEKAYEPFVRASESFVPFRDVARGTSSFPLSIIDCLRGLAAGIRLGWFDWKTFDVDDYVHYQHVDNGDMNWVIPKKFLAFAGPFTHKVDAYGNRACTPACLAPVFKKKSVEVVIRLNSKQYHQDEFINGGIKHADLVFKDGSCPSDKIIDKFMYIAENTIGAVAVHCKAGLGRTGTLIGLYAMKHYGMKAREYIAWSRLCRPGCVIGPQQQFLCDMQEEMFRLGSMRFRALTPPELQEASPSKGKTDAVDLARRLQELRIESARKYTDDGQGEHLVRAKQVTCSLREVDVPFQRNLLGAGLPTASPHVASRLWEKALLA
eukprot:TRINITY_DN8934_c0_g1_i1.p1 TRINITY_DN8934_c0_g1~~TRINITY_DN8934_c0_g1_i1.p1  ORF type:complete len:430 (-),score=83.19 TRINITY_DN8934_c0_g1_i1:88-1377(-)